MKKFIRHWLPTIIAILGIIAFVVAWTATWCAITAHNTRYKVTEELTEKYEAEFQAYVDSLTYVPEDVQKENEINELADWLDELIAGYAMNSNISLEGKYSIGWCFISRLMTQGYYGSTPEEILNKPDQWQWYSADNPVRVEDRAVARTIAADYINRSFPNGFTTDLNIAELKSDGSVVLRNELRITSNTKMWSYHF